MTADQAAPIFAAPIAQLTPSQCNGRPLRLRAHTFIGAPEAPEECGWRLGPLKLIGFHHFQPLGEKPKDHAYPWRDFIHLIHVAEGVAYDVAEGTMVASSDGPPRTVAHWVKPT